MVKDIGPDWQGYRYMAAQYSLFWALLKWTSGIQFVISILEICSATLEIWKNEGLKSVETRARCQAAFWQLSRQPFRHIVMCTHHSLCSGRTIDSTTVAYVNQPAVIAS
jgi:hypothetical protein